MLLLMQLGSRYMSRPVMMVLGICVGSRGRRIRGIRDRNRGVIVSVQMAIYRVELWLMVSRRLVVMMMVVMVMMGMMLGSLVQFRCGVGTSQASGSRNHLPAAYGQGRGRFLPLS